PANGTLDIARFPIISVAFTNPIPCDQTSLQNGIRLLDRTGQPFSLMTRCSGFDSSVALASPIPLVNRLEPDSDYFLEISLGTSQPSQVTRIHFTTGGLKSVFCLQKQIEDWSADLCSQTNTLWKTSCDENFYRRPDVGDPVIRDNFFACRYSFDPNQ